MNIAISAFAKMLLAFLVLIQKDEDGVLLVNGHLGLAFVCIALVCWAMASLFFELGVAYVEEHNERESIISDHTSRSPRNDYRSSELDRLNSVFDEKGSFASLTKRFD